jgi:hypothetical protein
MSRIGNMPITVPAGVEVKIDGNHIAVKGPKGSLERDIHPNMKVELDGNEIKVSRPDDTNINKSLHGTTRALIHNMVEGVVNEFKVELEINGVGYRAQKQGNKLVMKQDNPLIEQFLDMLWLERGLSDNTISSYRTDLYKLNDWLDSKASSYLTLDTLLLHNYLELPLKLLLS